MNKIKKHLIGYNTVSSVDGVISAKGVKSKPNNIRVFGYTYEIGEGEKSPDNHYKLIGLDSGNVVVNGVEYEHSIVLSNKNISIHVPIAVELNCVKGISDYIFKDNDGFWKAVQNCRRYEFTGNETITNAFDKEKRSFSNSNYAVLDHFYNDSPIFAVCTHFTTARKNYPTAVEFLNSENNYSFSLKKSDANKERLIRFRYDEITNVSNFTDFLSKQHDNGTPVTVVYRLALPVTHTLCDYAQNLLNSFMLENDNYITINGNPDFTVSGFLKKE